MKKVLIGLGVLFGILVLLIVGVSLFALLARPSFQPASGEAVAASDEAINRGNYLFNHVGACTSCHTPHDHLAFGVPPTTDQVAIGYCFPEEMGLPGEVCAANLTPHDEAGIGGWSDGEVMRAIREGVDRNGRPLFMMELYRFSEEDVRAVVAYLRSIPASPNEVPETELFPPVKLFMRFFPQPLEAPIEHPSPEDTVAYGEYLVELGGCRGCHTGPNGTYAGGDVVEVDAKRVVVPNITPHETGIGALSRAGFISRFKAWQEVAEVEGDSDAFSFMPWIPYSGMTEEDLGAIYDFLRTVEPIATVAPQET